MSQHDALTLDELTMLFATVGSSEDSPGRRVLLKMMRYEPLAEMYRELLQMAENAGTPRHLEGWERTAYEDNALFDRLLETVSENSTRDGVDLRRFADTERQTLLKICAARKEQGRADREALLELERKLGNMN